MDVDEYPITNSVFEHWFNSRLARKESEKGIREYCNATEESYQKLHAHYKDSEHQAQREVVSGNALRHDCSNAGTMRRQYQRNYE